MSRSHPKKVVNLQLNFDLDAPEPSKMAAAAPPCGVTKAMHGIAAPPPPSLPSQATVSDSQGIQGFLASPASLLGRIQIGIPIPIPKTYSPLTNTPNSLLDSLQASPVPPYYPPDMTQLLSSFSDMLAAGLAQNAAQITSSIKADLQSLGARMDAIEQAVDDSAARTNQNTSCIQSLQEQTALSKLDDLENRSRQYNFRVRGIPESNIDIHDTVKSLIKDIFPDIPDHKLEIDRAHRVPCGRSGAACHSTCCYFEEFSSRGDTWSATQYWVALFPYPRIFRAWEQVLASQPCYLKIQHI